jgi:hypothetical protein
MRIVINAPDLKDLARQGERFARAEQKAMHLAVDRATNLGLRAVQQRIKAVGLGRLAGAVGYTSSEKKRRRDPNNAWGAVFARGGDESRGGGALEAYTKGATIRGRNVTWLAIATRALPKMISAGGRRARMTPERYEAAGNPLGPLVFKRLNANTAILIAQGDFAVSRKTGRAKPFAGRQTRTRVKQRDVVAFVLIRETKRAKRFDQVEIVRRAASKVPDFLAEEMRQALPGTLEKG